ncbi:MAG: type ISP restriction/modification enzyme [Deltaproteobacteria bacterium]
MAKAPTARSPSPISRRQAASGDLPTLKVLGWDDADTALHISHVHHELQEKLRWPEDEKDLDGWRERWSSAFTLRHRQVITTSKDLAVRLAALAKSIRSRAEQVLTVETDRGPLRKLHKAFREALIHDLSEDDFADMYAQTIAYGLLAARVSRPMGIIAENVTDMVPMTNPFLREMLGTFLTIGGRKGKLDFDELGIQDVVDLLNNRDTQMEAILRDFGNRTRQEDPVIHFYELFLAEYDKKMKVKRGVFYTPQPVVSYIVRSVHELLQTEFGLPDGLADTTTWGEMAARYANPESSLPSREGSREGESVSFKIPDGVSPDTSFVQILDIATGTATFLVEVIDIIHKTMTAKWEKEGHLELEFAQLWNAYVPKRLLPRLYGYELMMAPYAIAHMKIGLKLYETGYRFGSDERIHVYLTNALEPPQDFSDRLAFDAPALAHEAAAVNAVKRHKRFTVVIGNPPYSISSSNLSELHRAIVDPYKSINGARIVEKGARQFEKNIQDDYVKFIRLAEVTISSAGTGIVGYITNHSYLTNPTFRGLRYSLLQSFQRGDLVDLHGNTLYGEAKEAQVGDENVFDIKQGVAICLLRSQQAYEGHSFNRSDYWGSRKQKYRELGKRSIQTDKREPLHPGPDFWVFRVEDQGLREEYQTFPRISELMPVNSTGVKTHRDHFAVAFDQNVLKSRLRAFRDLSVNDKDIESRFDLADTDAWRLSAKRRSLASKKDWEKFIALTIHRPFDLKWIYYHPDVVELPRSEVMQNLLPRGSDNAAICFPRNLREGWKRHAFVSRDVVHKDALSSLDTCYAAPLFVTSKTELNLSQELTPNLAKTGREWVKLLGLEVSAKTCWSVFAYFYAVLFAPSYGKRYAEFLKIDFPRLPLTSSLDLFRNLARLGGELAALHLVDAQVQTGISIRHDKTEGWTYAYGTPPPVRIVFTGTEEPVVDKVGWSDDTVWINAVKPKKGAADANLTGTIGFRGVPEEVWNFRIGGYQVCQKWLKDRKGRTLVADDLIHYHRIIVALNETIRIMREIDEVIDAHGGWPLK